MVAFGSRSLGPQVSRPSASRVGVALPPSPCREPPSPTQGRVCSRSQDARTTSGPRFTSLSVRCPAPRRSGPEVPTPFPGAHPLSPGLGPPPGRHFRLLTQSPLQPLGHLVLHSCTEQTPLLLSRRLFPDGPAHWFVNPRIAPMKGPCSLSRTARSTEMAEP